MGNTEGSQVISNTFKVRKNIILRLTNRQMSIVIGSILGDAYVHPLGKICFEQAINQKDYLLWKYDELKNLAYPKIGRVIRFDRRYGKENISFRFFLKQFFRPLRNYIYEDNRKTIPNGIEKWLTPLAISVWYMDDGHLERGRYPTFASESFSIKEVERFIFILKNKFGIKAKVGNKKRIRIKSESKDNFFQLVRPFIHKSMEYKLP